MPPTASGRPAAPGGTATPIWQKTDTAAQAALKGVDPGRAALYHVQLAAAARAAAKQRLGAADVLAKTIVAAVEARHPKRRYLAGPGTPGGEHQRQRARAAAKVDGAGRARGGRKRGVEPVVTVGGVQLVVRRLEVESHPRT